jgi:hypothetical protein
MLGEAMLHWPGPNPAWPEALDAVQPAASRLAAKLYAKDWPGGAADVGGPGDWHGIAWGQGIESLGIWLNYGGWPSPGKVHHIALEATNAPADHLGQAMAMGVRPLAAGAVRAWTVTFTLGATPPASATENHSLAS